MIRPAFAVKQPSFFLLKRSPLTKKPSSQTPDFPVRFTNILIDRTPQKACPNKTSQSHPPTHAHIRHAHAHYFLGVLRRTPRTRSQRIAIGGHRGTLSRPRSSMMAFFHPIGPP